MPPRNFKNPWPQKWYAAFFYATKPQKLYDAATDTYQLDPTDFAARVEMIVLPPVVGLRAQPYVFDRERRGKSHRSVWREDMVGPVTIANRIATYERAGYVFAKPIIVEVNMADVEAQLKGQGKDKAPYFVINRVRRILARRGDIQ